MSRASGGVSASYASPTFCVSSAFPVLFSTVDSADVGQALHREALSPDGAGFRLAKQQGGGDTMFTCGFGRQERAVLHR